MTSEESEKSGENGIIFRQAIDMEACTVGLRLYRRKTGTIDIDVILPTGFVWYIGAYNPQRRAWGARYQGLADWFNIDAFIDAHEILFTEKEKKNDTRRKR